jgi:hypothetical protein
MLGVSEEARKAVFDIHCENEKGEKFIVEIQKSKQSFFKDRTLYYSTFPITRQAISCFSDSASNEIYTLTDTLSLHDALPISAFQKRLARRFLIFIVKTKKEKNLSLKSKNRNRHFSRTGHCITVPFR